MINIYAFKQKQCQMNFLWSKLYRINVNNSIQNKDTSLYVNIVNYTLDKNSDHSKENKATNTLNTYTMYKKSIWEFCWCRISCLMINPLSCLIYSFENHKVLNAECLPLRSLLYGILKLSQNSNSTLESTGWCKRLFVKCRTNWRLVL